MVEASERAPSISLPVPTSRLPRLLLASCLKMVSSDLISAGYDDFLPVLRRRRRRLLMATLHSSLQLVNTRVAPQKAEKEERERVKSGAAAVQLGVVFVAQDEQKAR